MKQAIQKAIEGGWKVGTIKVRWYENWQPNFPYIALVGVDMDSPTMSINDVFNDPLFWQSLGKALGWTVKLVQEGNWDDMETMQTVAHDRWKYEWHRFIDHLSEGKDPESFFKELLPPPDREDNV